MIKFKLKSNEMYVCARILCDDKAFELNQEILFFQPAIDVKQDSSYEYNTVKFRYIR